VADSMITSSSIMHFLIRVSYPEKALATENAESTEKKYLF